MQSKLEMSKDLYRLLNNYESKTVLLTGYTGFKGTWMIRVLLLFGAKVIGYSLTPPTEPNLYNLAGFDEYISNGQLVSIIADVRDLVTMFCDKWNEKAAPLPKITWENKSIPNAPHEAGFLKLDSTKIKQRLGYTPRWHIDECIEKTVQFSRVYIMNPDAVYNEMDRQISDFFS